MTLVVMQVKWSVTLTDRLGPEILTVLERKGQVLHRVRLHVKVPGWSLNLNALLTKKLPKFLSRLNEMSGGRENMCLVSGSLRRILKFFRMTFLIARFCGWAKISNKNSFFNWVHSLHTELMNASHSTNLFTNSCNHISTNGNALLHSHINHNNPQFLYSL